MVRPKTYTFENSQTCSGIGITSDTSISHDVIEITGRYPEAGSWARNREAQEEVIIARGVGTVALRGIAVFELDAEDDARRTVIVEPDEWFAWDGDMTISMVCRPPFDPEKYEIKSEEAIKEEVKDEV